MKFDVTCPTRVDLAGGTIDCWPLYLLVGDCATVNLSIDIKTRSLLEPRSDKKISLNIKDLSYQKEFESLEALIQCPDQELLLVKEHIKYWQPKKGFQLSTESQSPVGGGLGGSSSLTVSLLKAFGQWLGHKWELNEIVDVAHNIEARVLKTPTGTQDYVPAAQPGLNAIHYTVNEPRFELLDFPAELFNENMLLVYTGRSHHSGINNWQVIRAAMEGDKKTIDCLKQIARISDDLLKLCKDNSWQDLASIFKAEYDVRTKISESFTSPEIERLNEIALSHGADATKICGAGGGGCVMIWCGDGDKDKIKAACAKEGFQVLNAQAVSGIS